MRGIFFKKNKLILAAANFIEAITISKIGTRIKYSKDTKPVTKLEIVSTQTPQPIIYLSFLSQKLQLL